MPPPLRESHISACWIFPGVSASTDATSLGRRHLSWLRTQPTHHHIYPGAGGAPKPQASPTFLLGEGAQILLDPTQCLADECPQSSCRKRPLLREPSLGRGSCGVAAVAMLLRWQNSCLSLPPAGAPKGRSGRTPVGLLAGVGCVCLQRAPGQAAG